MTLKSSSKRRRKLRKNSQLNFNKKSNISLNNVQYAVQLTKQAYEEREQICSYKDYLALITLATFNEHEIKHIQVEKKFFFFKLSNFFSIILFR
jgi:hypothetical protein